MRDDSPVVDSHGHELEWIECSYCLRGFYRRIGAWGDSCGHLSCDLARDRVERDEQMTSDERMAYSRAADGYFARPGETDERVPRDRKSGLKLTGFAQALPGVNG